MMDLLDDFNESDLLIISQQTDAIEAEYSKIKEYRKAENYSPKSNKNALLFNAHASFPLLVDDDVILAQDLANPHQIDREACKTWIYPVFKEVRKYQFEIIKEALLQNTLVALPTGLGKTFIAAIVMLNWLRWCTTSKILFLAPTKPLLQQQELACREFFGAFCKNITYIDGSIHYTKRTELVNKNRVLFCTSQVAERMLEKEIINADSICCIIIDEAHRATGNFSYVLVVNKIAKQNPYFRVLALTATPGIHRDSVNQVLSNLRISNVQFRDREHPDIAQYVQETEEITQEFEISQDIVKIRDLYSKSFEKQFNYMKSLGAVVRDIHSITVFGLVQDRKYWIVKSRTMRDFKNANALHPYFNVLTTLAGPMDILQIHGILAFKLAIEDLIKQSKNFKSGGNLLKEVLNSSHFNNMLVEMNEMTLESNFFGHPKLESLLEILNEHFKMDNDTRVMVFTSLRFSAQVIVDLLNLVGKKIRASIFIGQSSSVNNIAGMSRKEQEETIKKFKSGEFNCLVATCIGEEGLDIGELDLVVTFDQSASLVRNRQRVGRTGRKRAGVICHFTMQGKEKSKMQRAIYSFRELQKSLKTGRDLQINQNLSLRIIPKDISPECNMIDIDQHTFEKQPKTKEQNLIEIKASDYQRPILGMKRKIKVSK